MTQLNFRLQVSADDVAGNVADRQARMASYFYHLESRLEKNIYFFTDEWNYSRFIFRMEVSGKHKNTLVSPDPSPFLFIQKLVDLYSTKPKIHILRSNCSALHIPYFFTLSIYIIREGYRLTG